MHGFKALKKTLVSVIIFAAAVCLMSAPLIICYLRGTTAAENDIIARDHYAGTIDTFIIGGSQVEYGLDPKIIDPAAGFSSYNMSCVWQSLYGERILARQELARNPVKRVYIGVCLDTLTRTDDNDDGQGEIIMLPRIRGLGSKLDYMLHCGQLSDLPGMFYYYTHHGMIRLLNIIRGRDYSILDFENRGFVPYLLPDQDMTYDLGGEISVRDYYENGITVENRENFLALIRECREAGAEVVIFATPLSQVFLEYFDGWDDYLDQVEELAREAGVTAPVLDFNLYKGRAQLFEDGEDFYNWNHLNYSGSQKFSKIFAEAVSDAYSGEMFYNSYAEMFEAEK